MQCPKGLRNGPCGGMCEGLCEVDKERPCIWTGIREQAKAKPWTQFIRGPVNAQLFGTSSWLNLATGQDRATRQQISLTDSGDSRPAPTGALASNLKSGRFSVTLELRTPRLDNGVELARRLDDASLLAPLVESLSVTAHPGAMPPEEFCRKLSERDGVETIQPIVGRDRSPEWFTGQLPAQLAASRTGAVLALTGDYTGTAPFPMDSAQILYALRQLNWAAQRPLFGAALHIPIKPEAVVLGRARQKVLAGADVLFSQVLTGDEPIESFLRSMRRDTALASVPVMLGVPLIGSENGLNKLCELPGISPSSTLKARFEKVENIRAAGFAFATSLAQQAQALKSLGVVGIHLMPFGIPAKAVGEWIESIRPAATATCAGTTL